jgi:hypothetical protein
LLSPIEEAVCERLSGRTRLSFNPKQKTHLPDQFLAVGPIEVSACS